MPKHNGEFVKSVTPAPGPKPVGRFRVVTLEREDFDADWEMLRHCLLGYLPVELPGVLLRPTASDTLIHSIDSGSKFINYRSKTLELVLTYRPKKTSLFKTT
jgi:hypothetical protein